MNKKAMLIFSSKTQKREIHFACMDMGYYKINIQGIVQGVGFRPFLFNLAEQYGLTGSIINKGNVGVELLLYSSNKAILTKFLSDIRTQKPPISYIEDIDIEDLDINNFSNDEILKIRRELHIKPSKSGIGSSVTSPPDIAICSDCVDDMNNPSNVRYYHYPFTACAGCGPRFTTITELPYDRERTTMNEFPFCKSSSDNESSCLLEYTSPKNRRFHAQTYSCKECGPNYFFLYNPEFISNPVHNEEDASKLMNVLKDREKIKRNAFEAIKIASEYILSGKIVAVMGIGGVHIVGNARNPELVELIRTRKRKRKTKPFAIMVRGIESVEKYAFISKAEKAELTSFRRPIVLLKKKQQILPDSIAPGLHNIGIMLPYAGIHHLLFQLVGNIPLIFTSGNFSDIPMAISPTEVVQQLSQLVDGYLLHNRVIYQRADDSVLRVFQDYPRIIRRSRGYVPEYFPLPFTTSIKGGIAVGPELSSTGLVARGHRLFPTQHIGNVDNFETYSFLQNAILHMKSLLKLKDSELEFISMDLHPRFHSTKLANQLHQEFNIPYSFQIQHHFAHAASLMVDNKISKEESVVISTLDGVGYGTDEKVWGGEVIRGTYEEMFRTHHLSYIPMIGGDLCVTYPARMTMGFLLKLYGSKVARELAEKLELYRNLPNGHSELETLLSSFALKENIAYSSGCGRLLDTIANLLGVGVRKNYRGEPAMRLEGLAALGNPHQYDFSSQIVNSMKNGVLPSELLIQKVIKIILKDQLTYKIKRDIAASSLFSIGKAFAIISFREAESHNIHNIGLSGGVAYNDFVNVGFYDTLQELCDTYLYPLNLLQHKKVPPGDAGISVGQAAIAISKIS
jgi:hydrogenase maturation protein HypF